MKKLIRKGMALWLALALAASMLPAGFAAGESSSSSGSGPAQSAEEADDTNLPYEYELDEDGNATLTKYTGSEAEVVTPKTIDGHPVTRLEGTFRQPEEEEAGAPASASSSAGEEKAQATEQNEAAGIRSITVSEGVEYMDGYTFANLSTLEKVSLPSTLKQVNGYTFEGLENLKEVALSEGLETIQTEAFRNTGIETIVLPETLQTIGAKAFESEALKEITVPAGVTRIGGQAFRTDTELTIYTTMNSTAAVYAQLNQIDVVYTDYVAVAEVTLDKTELTLVEGETGLLKADVLPEDATEKTVTWESSDPAVATVDENGTITAVKEGQVAITAKAGQASASCTVTVNPIDDSVTVGWTQDGLHYVRADGSYMKGLAEIDGQYYIFSEDDGTLQKGENVPYGGYTYGTDDKGILISVTVPDGVTELPRGEFTIPSLKTFTIPASVTYMGAGCIPVAEGVAVRAPYGSTAHVYAQLNNLSFAYTDTVTVTLDQTELELVKGREKTLTASVSPAFAQEFEQVWASSNPDVATVENGVVKGLELGEADITLEVDGVKAVCHVTVKDKVCDAHWEGEQYIQEDGEPARGIVEIEGKSYLFREEDGAVQKNAENFAYGDYEYSTDEAGVIVGVRVPEGVTSVPGKQFFSLKQLQTADVGGHVTYLGADFVDAACGVVIYTSQGSLAAVYAKMRNIPVRYSDGDVPLEGISLSETQLLLRPQEAASLQVSYEPWDATDRAVTWSSSDPAVATVDETGLVTALANGTAVITAQVGGKTASCTVDVADRNTWVEQGGDTYYIGEDGQFVTGYQEIEEKFYIFDEEGHLQKGTITYEGQRFLAGEDGALYVQAFVEGEDGVTYYGEDGAAVVGWFETAQDAENHPAGRYYQDDQTYLLAVGLVPLGDTVYYFDASGRLHTQAGYVTVDGQQYYITADGIYSPPPVITDVTVSYNSKTGENTVKVTATFGAAGAAEKAYSFDGGKTWQSAASYTFKVTKDTTLAKDSVQVRDAAQPAQVEKYGYELALKGPVTGPLKGIDVSSHQGTIDWQAVADSGVQFVIVRAMCWSNAAGGYAMDSKFVENVKGAKAAGLMVGAYWYSDAFNGSEAREEVSFIANSSEWKALKDAGITLDLPFYIDYEDPWILKNNHSTYDSRTDAVRSGMVAVEQMLGTATGFYASESWMKTQFDGAGLMNEGYNAWVAHWGSSQGMGNVQMWQYSNAGSVPGISTNVDLNWLYPSGAGGSGSSDGTGSSSGNITVWDVNTSKSVTANTTEILKKIVANEVGGFTSAQLSAGDRRSLYQAQAVAAHSWLIYQIRHGVSTPSVGLASSYSSEISSAVESVKDVLVKYNGDVANTAYGSCAAEKTNSAANMGWGNYAYLVSVDSAFEQKFAPSQYYPRATTIKQETMRSNVIKMVGETVFKAYESRPESWITEIHTDANGYVDYAVVCGQRITGGRFYENCWGMYGANLVSWSYNSADRSWVITTNGNGHGVGMSQYGAAGYIAQYGWSYTQVLQHYFPGASVV